MGRQARASPGRQGRRDALGFHYLDTGAMYRAVAHRALQTGIDPATMKRVAAIAPNHPSSSLTCPAIRFPTSVASPART